MLLAAFAAAPNVNAQSESGNSAIEGTVLDGNGAAIAGATVVDGYADEVGRELVRFLKPPRTPVKTDAEGRFRFSTIRPGPVLDDEELAVAAEADEDGRGGGHDCQLHEQGGEEHLLGRREKPHPLHDLH